MSPFLLVFFHGRDSDGHSLSIERKKKRLVSLSKQFGHQMQFSVARLSYFLKNREEAFSRVV